MAGKLRHYVLRETLIWVIIGLVLLCAGYIVAPTSTLEPLYGAVPYVYPVTSPTYVFVNTSSMEVPTQLPTATPTVRNRISPTCPIAALGTVLDFATVPEAWGRGYYDTTVIARGFKHGEIIPDARVITSYSSARTAKEYADSGDEPAVREFVGISSKPIKGGLTGYIKYFGMQQDSARCLVLDEAQQSTIYGLLIGNVCSRMLSYVCSRMLTSMWRRNMHCHAIYSETSPTYVPVNTPLGVTTQILTAITSTPNKILLTGSISSIETGLDFVTIPTTWGLEYYDTVSRVAGFKYEEMIQDTRRATNSITTRAAREYADVPTARDFAGSDSTQMIGNKSFVFQWDPGMGMA
jgi:hypothetical protein